MNTAVLDTPGAQQLRKRRVALLTVCAAVLMIVLDTTVVNVALPAIRDDLQFSESGLVWVVNAYLLAFAGTLLLGGRLGDLYGQRTLFLTGLAAFTLASFFCGLAWQPWILIAARVVQGMGGAITLAVALSLIVTMFPDASERAKAMSRYSFVAATGGSIGLVLGGALTSLLGWHWIFLINLPIGMLVFCVCRVLLAQDSRRGSTDVDFAGAISVTVALVILVYAILHATQVGWDAVETLGLLAAASVSVFLFVAIEAKASSPLLPPATFGIRSLTASTLVRFLWAAGGYSWFFSTALYMQSVAGYGSMEVGLAFLPSNAITAIFAVGWLASLVRRFGIKKPLVTGLFLVAGGYTLFANTSIEASMLAGILPGMILVGLGTGISFGPLLLAAMTDVPPRDSGLASGLLNTAAIVGGALGLALVTSLVSARTRMLEASGLETAAALLGGYHVGFLMSAVLVAAAAVLGALMLRPAATTGSPLAAEREAAQREGFVLEPTVEQRRRALTRSGRAKD